MGGPIAGPSPHAKTLLQPQGPNLTFFPILVGLGEPSGLGAIKAVFEQLNPQAYKLSPRQAMGQPCPPPRLPPPPAQPLLPGAVTGGRNHLGRAPDLGRYSPVPKPGQPSAPSSSPRVSLHPGAVVGWGNTLSTSRTAFWEAEILQPNSWENLPD